MDLITTALAAALSAGATSGLTEVAKKAIAEGYEALKSLVHSKFGGASEIANAVASLEAKPDSSGRKTTLEEEVKASNAAAEPELVAAAQALLKLIEVLPESVKVQIAQGTGIAQAMGAGSSASVTFEPAPWSHDGPPGKKE